MVLKKLNPLFLDSTKASGDNFIFNIELCEIVLNAGEVVYFELIGKQGVNHRFVMNKFETKKTTKYRCDIWSKQNQEIQYRLVIDGSGQERLSAPAKATLDRQKLIVRWEDCASLESKSAKESANKKSRDLKNQSTKSFCTPYLSEQLKLLIDDLT